MGVISLVLTAIALAKIHLPMAFWCVLKELVSQPRLLRGGSQSQITRFSFSQWRKCRTPVRDADPDGYGLRRPDRALLKQGLQGRPHVILPVLLNLGSSSLRIEVGDGGIVRVGARGRLGRLLLWVEAGKVRRRPLPRGAVDVHPCAKGS